MSISYWRGAAEDEAMQDEHGFIWRAMLDTIETELAGRRVLDAGCNRGGFLRLLVDHAGIAEGHGYDPASGAIETPAVSPAAGRSPLRPPPQCQKNGPIRRGLQPRGPVPAGGPPRPRGWSLRRLEASGSYFAVMGVHAGSPLMSAWHAEDAVELGLPGSTTSTKSLESSRTQASPCRLLT